MHSSFNSPLTLPFPVGLTLAPLSAARQTCPPAARTVRLLRHHDAHLKRPVGGREAVAHCGHAGSVLGPSTWLYNELCILMRLRYSNIMYGWHKYLEDLCARYAGPQSNATTAKDAVSHADAFCSLGTTVLLKLLL